MKTGTRTVVTALLFLMAASAQPVHSDHGEPSVHRYLATQVHPIPIWCAAGGQNYLPEGNPDDHDAPEGWLFSGQPECVVGATLMGTDAHNGISAIVETSFYRDGSGTAVDHRGEFAYYRLDDDRFSQDVPFVASLDVAGESTDYDVHMEGCGDFGILVPLHWQTAWQPWPAYQYTWVYLSNAHVTSGLDVCLGSTGTVQVTYAKV